jgi:hypothetical protein
MDYNLFCGIGRKSNIIKTLRQFDPVRKTRNQLRIKFDKAWAKNIQLIVVNKC